MTRELFVRILLWYNVVSLAVWVGGTVYQMLVIVPLWSASPPESLRSFLQGTAFTTTIYNFFGPVTQLTRVPPVFILALVGWNQPQLRPWLLVCAGTMLVGLVMTRAYIYPMNELLAKAGDGLSADAVRALVRKWIIADRVRFAIMSAGYLCLLRAFSLPTGAGH